jgi:hypothetical protein
MPVATLQNPAWGRICLLLGLIWVALGRMRWAGELSMMWIKRLFGRELHAEGSVATLLWANNDLRRKVGLRFAL